MMKPPTPLMEKRRLATLRSLSILDCQPDERFDRITRIARRLFNVPIALISLVDDDRQWFMSRQGLGATETPRDISFCGHTILGDAPFVVENATDDDRFCDNPLVTSDPNIRFYAGRPLTINGRRIGTLCIIDRVPRQLTADELALLNDLADVVEAELLSAEMATVDELTGLSNLRGFNASAKNALAACQRFGKGAALLLIDLDDFKQINDTFGHAAGDSALKDMANLLVLTFRGSDNIARLGGDEFCVLLSGTGASELPIIESRLAKAVETMNRFRRVPYTISYSGGAVSFDPDIHPNINALMRDADVLLYERKPGTSRIIEPFALAGPAQ